MFGILSITMCVASGKCSAPKG